MSLQKEIDIPLLILAGGLGSRLRSITGRQLPKPMVQVFGKPFLFWLIDDLTSQGFWRIWLSVGYRYEAITSYPWEKAFPSCEFVFLIEKNPLGTGGAIKMFFTSEVNSTECIVVNGDTHLVHSEGIPLNLFDNVDSDVHFLTIHEDSLNLHQEANLCVSGNKVVLCGKSRLPTQFDTGVIKFTRKSVNRCNKSAPYSLQELIAPSVECGNVVYSELEARCFDVGTPERLIRYQEFHQERGFCTTRS